MEQERPEAVIFWLFVAVLFWAVFLTVTFWVIP